MVCLLPFPGVNPTQPRTFYCLPCQRTVKHENHKHHEMICRIGVPGTGKTTIMYLLWVVQAVPGGQSAGCKDPLANLCDGLPGLEAADITALLRDLPIPTPGDVPGMTVEEAIEVLFGIYHAI